MTLWSHDVWPFEALSAYERFDSISNYLNGRMNNATKPYTIYVHKLRNYPGFVKIGITSASFNLRHIDEEYGELLYTSCQDQSLMEKLKRDVPKADAFLCEQALFSILEHHRQQIPQLKYRRWSGYTETFSVTGREVRLQGEKKPKIKRKPGYFEGILRAVAPVFFDEDETDSGLQTRIEYDYEGFKEKIKNNIHDLLTGDIRGWKKMISHTQTLEEHRLLANKRESMFREVMSRRASASKPKIKQNKDIPRTSKQSQENTQSRKSFQLSKDVSINKDVEQKRPPQVQGHHRLDFVSKDIDQEYSNNDKPIVKNNSKANKVKLEEINDSFLESSQDRNQFDRSVKTDSSLSNLNEEAKWRECEVRDLIAKQNDANHQNKKEERSAITMQAINDFLREPDTHPQKGDIKTSELCHNKNNKLELTPEERLSIEQEIAFYDKCDDEVAVEPLWIIHEEMDERDKDIAVLKAVVHELNQAEYKGVKSFNCLITKLSEKDGEELIILKKCARWLYRRLDKDFVLFKEWIYRLDKMEPSDHWWHFDELGFSRAKASIREEDIYLTTFKALMNKLGNPEYQTLTSAKAFADKLRKEGDISIIRSFRALFGFGSWEIVYNWDIERLKITICKLCEQEFEDIDDISDFIRKQRKQRYASRWDIKKDQDGNLMIKAVNMGDKSLNNVEPQQEDWEYMDEYYEHERLTKSSIDELEIDDWDSESFGDHYSKAESDI